MRRAIVLLVLTTSVIFTVGASSPAPASASSCTPNTTTVFWTGFIEWNVQVNNCIGVDKVQFNRVVTVEGCAGKTPTLNNFCATGIYDGTEHDIMGLTGSHVAPDYANGPSYTQNVIAGSQSTDWVIWRVPSWCGGANHWIASQFMFRIHAYGGLWGPWHYARSTGYPILC